MFSRQIMSGRLILFILLATAILAAGCKPAPKSSRAGAQESSQDASQQERTPVTQEIVPDAQEPAVESKVPSVTDATDANRPPATGIAADPNSPAVKADKAAPAIVIAPPDPNVPDANQPVVAGPVNADAQEPNDLGNSFNARFKDILSIYVNSEGAVDYSRLRRMRLLFAPLMQELDDLSPEEYDSWPEAEKIAFWINTYNVCMLKVVTDNYPVKASVYKMVFYPANSVMQIDRVWSDYRFSIMGVAYSLSEIEQRILLNRFTEPRVAFALCYASKWSPRLVNRPYYGQTLDRQLDRQTREFISSDRGFKIDKDAATVYLSIVFKETRFHPGFVEKYGSDLRFNDDKPETRAMLNFISMYLDRADVDYLTGKKYLVTSVKPDWTLND